MLTEMRFGTIVRMAIILLSSVLFYELRESDAVTVRSATENPFRNPFDITWRIEIFNRLRNDLKAHCYSNRGSEDNSVIVGGSNHNITFQDYFSYWCCSFVSYDGSSSPHNVIIQSFVVSSALGSVSDAPEIDCNTRCSWRVDARGFSVFYNGEYRRLHKWFHSTRVNSTAEGRSSLACNLALAAQLS